MRVSSPIPHKKARIEIIPLIDIMFFLLASFMMVSLSQVHMKGIKVNLPSGQSGETQTKREYLSVSVDRDGHYFFDKDEVKDEQLLNLLKMAHQSAPDAKVFLDGARCCFSDPPDGGCNFAAARSAGRGSSTATTSGCGSRACSA